MSSGRMVAVKIQLLVSSPSLVGAGLFGRCNRAFIFMSLSLDLHTPPCWTLLCWRGIPCKIVCCIDNLIWHLPGPEALLARRKVVIIASLQPPFMNLNAPEEGMCEMTQLPSAGQLFCAVEAIGMVLSFAASQRGQIMVLLSSNS
eukprot:EG_transcript_36276